MAVALTVLDAITIATPCTVSWNGMKGDERIRFCTKCNHHVHDISEMTAADALQFVNSTNESVCVRLYRRPDGRVLTADCALTLREKTWKWLLARSAWAATLFAPLLLSGCSQPLGSPTKTSEPSQKSNGTEVSSGLTMGTPCVLKLVESTQNSSEPPEQAPMPRPAASAASSAQNKPAMPPETSVGK